MPDAARDWLRWYDEHCDGSSMAPTHLRRLLEANERLARGLGAFELRVIDLGQRVATKHVQNVQLEADKSALVAYVRAKTKHTGKFTAENYQETEVARQALSDELKELIDVPVQRLDSND